MKHFIHDHVSRDPSTHHKPPSSESKSISHRFSSLSRSICITSRGKSTPTARVTLGRPELLTFFIYFSVNRYQELSEPRAT